MSKKGGKNSSLNLILSFFLLILLEEENYHRVEMQ